MNKMNTEAKIIALKKKYYNPQTNMGRWKEAGEKDGVRVEALRQNAEWAPSSTVNWGAVDQGPHCHTHTHPLGVFLRCSVQFAAAQSLQLFVTPWPTA